MDELSEFENYVKGNSALLAKAIQAVIDNDVSNFPIIVMYKTEHELALGINLYKAINKDDWNIHISTLEEMVSKSLIAQDKIEEFKKVYKPVESHFCIMQIIENRASFIFIPR